ncbi:MULTISPECIES: hypothetical protein [unclassified Duganella]|uniref:hypothetical protein n=1 Tax=unclassified Duganella TaxID=2636909 RepID=UPI000B87B8C5|nr:MULTISPECIES: hypothetical protein [unclassified Duganella]
MPNVVYFHAETSNLNQNDVKRVIDATQYKDYQYTIAPLVSGDGFTVTGDDPMAVSPLQAAAKKLKLRFVISSGVSAQVEGGPTPYTVAFSMSADTVQALQGSTLVVFKGVKSQGGSNGAAPLAWFTFDGFSTSNTLSWTEDYSAYVSTSKIIPKGIITASDTHEITFGETMNVIDGGLGQVVDGGQKNAISVNNTTSTLYTSGIAQVPPDGSAAQPLCAFNLYGNHENLFIPEEKVFLMFVSGTVKLGTVVAKSIGQGLLADLTGVQKRDGIVYDINAGWSWGGGAWGQAIAPNSDLSPLLIDSVGNHVSNTLRPRLSLAA